MNAQDLWRAQGRDKLIRTEISTLIGLMVREPIDMSLPAPGQLEGYIDQTESLLEELHRAMQRPWFQGWNFEAGEPPEEDPFDNAAAMREPIFYSADSAYDFQYRDFAPIKYGADDDWLQKNKGFWISDACKVAEAVSKEQVKRQIECIRLLPEKAPSERTILPAFIFTTEDAVKVSSVAKKIVERILDAFSCGPHERNEGFTALNEFSIANSKPILKTPEGSYILFQHYSLLEAIYESPFFWMNEDESYKEKALSSQPLGGAKPRSKPCFKPPPARNAVKMVAAGEGRARARGYLT